jgi:AcrR family transcriptional regulator
MTDQPATRPPGRPRSEATRTAILETAAALLEAEPYPRISIERIAADAKVGKQSIYRWWDSKADVLLEAYVERAFKRLPTYERSGDAFRDLEALLRAFFVNTRNPAVAKTIRSLIAEAQHDPEFRDKFNATFVAIRRAMFREPIEAGVARGQIRRDADVELIIDVLYGAFWYRLLTGAGDGLDDAFAKHLVALVRPALQAA